MFSRGNYVSYYLLQWRHCTFGSLRNRPTENVKAAPHAACLSKMLRWSFLFAFFEWITAFIIVRPWHTKYLACHWPSMEACLISRAGQTFLVLTIVISTISLVPPLVGDRWHVCVWPSRFWLALYRKKGASTLKPHVFFLSNINYYFSHRY